MPSKTSTLPFIIAGPILRKTTPSEITLWLVTTQPLIGKFNLYYPENSTPFYSADVSTESQIQIGSKAWVVLAHVKGHFPTDTALEYDLITQNGSLSHTCPTLLYPYESRVSFSINSKADYVLHGSCRNPHHFSRDSLVAADSKVATQSIEDRPSLLMMSGDQIYADHVAGPMLDAIQQVISLLGLPDENLASDIVPDSQSLYSCAENFYHRDAILPHYTKEDGLLAKFFPHQGIPIFSSTECENHLITFSEFFAMYLLVWSPTLWQHIDRERFLNVNFTQGGQQLSPKWQQVWRDETKHINDFVSGLGQVQRLLAHIPTYMIFDDHDITDDWNLTVGWEHAAQSNPLSKRIIGNGLISYWLCQGWGNAPEKFSTDFMAYAHRFFNQPNDQSQDDFIYYLDRFEQWHYTIDTQPKMVVLDTRTRRWRSESRMNKPSGLMDWEALIEMQHELMHQPAVILVSAAPMFGVKFIEALQKGMTNIGQPLVIDAENWMAHPGSANTLLSIFTHTKTPTNFVILSGDVHYSFAYDIKLRFRKSSPNIYQITCSGIKNQFPSALLKFCDGMDRFLYSPRSVLNWFTKRKRLKITKRSPDSQRYYRLVNQSAIGELKLDAEGKPSDISILTGEGNRISFPPTDNG
ncbi:alkaline phosphatase D family protein [Vibrio cortegadensis]|uniref:Alkaline phosphatase D family protein n=1 Tax=Vibrio cortegadensis TaxID=1328770 RepID=A0ABV4M5B1_9VIBR